MHYEDVSFPFILYMHITKCSIGDFSKADAHFHGKKVLAMASDTFFMVSACLLTIFTQDEVKILVKYLIYYDYH